MLDGETVWGFGPRLVSQSLKLLNLFKEMLMHIISVSAPFFVCIRYFCQPCLSLLPKTQKVTWLEVIYILLFPLTLGFLLTRHFALVCSFFVEFFAQILSSVVRFTVTVTLILALLEGQTIDGSVICSTRRCHISAVSLANNIGHRRCVFTICHFLLWMLF